jgi:outer membrane protein OmpA-like peptidoglycan-associated protein
MSIHKKIFGGTIAAAICLILLTTATAMVQAQVKSQVQDQDQVHAQADTTGSATTSTVAIVRPDMVFAPASTVSSSSTWASETTTGPSTTALPDAPLPMQDQMPRVQEYSTGNNASDSWRVGISLYGWFAGLHGTVGVAGHNAGIHVPFSDLFHALIFEIPIAVEADKGRFVMPIDFLWLKLGVNNALPLNDFEQSAIDSRMTESIFTPKFGYRLADADHFKFDLLGGLRYWYVSLNNTLEPAGLSYGRSFNIIDGIGGGRIILPAGEKAAITIAGDAGAGSSQLDYQLLGLLNVNFNPKFGMALGWRYLYEDYNKPSNGAIYAPTTSGVIAGLNFNLGGKPPIPPTASCSVSPAEVYAGDPVTATATPVGLNPKLSVVYTWTGDGVTGSGPTASVKTDALNPGTYPVRGEVKEGKPGKEGDKPWQVASCSTSYTVKPFQPPTITCLANPTSLNPGDPATVTAQGVSPQNRPLTYNYQASSGSISGSGATATFSSAGASPGPVQITCGVTDDKGQIATASVSVTVEAPPPPPAPEVEARLVLHSVYFPTAQPTVKHPDGGLVDSQKATLTALATDFKVYLQQKPDARLTLTGHADPRGTPAYNLKLSERRVARAAAFLVEQGVPASSIDIKAEGEEKQLSKEEVKDLIQTNPDLTEEQRTKLLRNLNVIVLAQNRRVDIRLNGSDEKSTRHYPFNAVDSSTLLDVQKPVHKASPRKR